MKNLILSVSERILLAEKLWGSVVDEGAEIGLSSEQARELDRRLDAYQKDRDRGSSWSEVKNRIIGNQ